MQHGQHVLMRVSFRESTAGANLHTRRRQPRLGGETTTFALRPKDTRSRKRPVRAPSRGPPRTTLPNPNTAPPWLVPTEAFQGCNCPKTVRAASNFEKGNPETEIGFEPL